MSPEGVPVGIIVHGREGLISELKFTRNRETTISFHCLRSILSQSSLSSIEGTSLLVPAADNRVAVLCSVNGLRKVANSGTKQSTYAEPVFFFKNLIPSQAIASGVGARSRQIAAAALSAI